MTGDDRPAEARVASASGLSWRTLDLEHPIQAIEHLAALDPGCFPFLLASSTTGTPQSRYTVLLADPGETLSVVQTSQASDFFAELDRLADSERTSVIPELPFIGGWFVYLGYELAEQAEPTLHLPRDRDDPFPLALAVRCRAGVVHDGTTDKTHVVCEAGSQCHADALAGRLVEASRSIRTGRDTTAKTKPRCEAWLEDPAPDYLDAVTAARDYILAGDVFQANLARTWKGRLAEDHTPARLYTALRNSNPAPFAGLMQWNGAALISSSPERLLAIRGDHATMRPIAGTRQRVAGQEQAMSAELITHPKERAEHVMLIDLVRNDLGRVCRPGSVTVDELMTIESYAHVHHIVSNVAGRLRPEVGPGSALRAVFPGGTITGCPKVRCMEIIAELEGRGRGAYTGSIGYLSRCGTLDTNIVIRSLVQHGRALTLRAGAGIVADSDPAAELAETRHKALGVLRAFVDRSGRPYG